MDLQRPTTARSRSCETEDPVRRTKCRKQDPEVVDLVPRLATSGILCKWPESYSVAGRPYSIFTRVLSRQSISTGHETASSQKGQTPGEGGGSRLHALLGWVHAIHVEDDIQAKGVSCHRLFLRRTWNEWSMLQSTTRLWVIFFVKTTPNSLRGC